MRNYRVLIGLCLLGCLSSCTRYLDIPSSRGQMILDKDSSVIVFHRGYNDLLWKSNTKFTSDREEFSPSKFAMRLPKGIIDLVIQNSEDFTFYYPKHQILYLTVPMDLKKPLGDTLYVPNSDQLDDLLSMRFMGQKTKLHPTVSNYIYEKPGRINRVLRVGNATIILYNIKKHRYHDFLDQVKRITFTSGNEMNHLQ